MTATPTICGRGAVEAVDDPQLLQPRARLPDRSRAAAGRLALEALDVAAINDYMLRESRRVSVSSTGAAAGALRSLLRILHVEGLDRDLAVAVPTVAK